MKEDVGQELYTRDHGTVKVDKVSFMDGGYHIVKCPNGTYMHANGLPIWLERELKAAISAPELADELSKAISWFRNRHTHEVDAPRAIMFHGDGYPIFADDGTVPDFDDLYAFFKPGPILTAAIVALQDYKKRQESGKPPKELRKAPEAIEDVPEATQPAPVPKAAKPKTANKGKGRTKKSGTRRAAATG
jgi:hypothetical protein